MSKLKYFDGTDWKDVNGQVTGDTLPIGSIIPYGGITPPTGWLLCWGQTVNKSSFPELFDAIGYAFGGEEGEPTFGIPNIKGKVVVGQDTSQTEFNEMGKTGGEKKHTLTIDEIPSHIHNMSPVTGTMPSGGNFEAEGRWVDGTSSGLNSYTDSAGGGQAHNILQPYMVTNYIIKAKQVAGLVGGVSDSSSNSHTDSYSCDYINNAVLDKYSTTEQIIGTWIDGSTIYRKIIYISELPNNASAVYATNISDINVVTKLSGIAFGSNGNSFPLPYVGRFGGDISADIELTFLAGDSTIRIVTGNDRSSLSAYICLEYTKD